MLNKSADDAATRAGETNLPNGSTDDILRALEQLRTEVQAHANEIRLLRAEVLAAGAGGQVRSAAPIAIAVAGNNPVRAILSRVGTVVSVHGRYAFAAIVVSCLLGWILFSNVGSNPAGFFCDEAEIGLETRNLLRHDLPRLRPSIFYHHFGYEHLGSLPLYAGAPVIAIVGFSDNAVRLASVIWGVLALLMLVALMRQLRWRNGEVAVALFAAAPVFIHLSRVNFGHAPSLFCVSAGLYAYVRGRRGQSWRWPALAGIAIGASIYGEAAWYIAAPIIIAGLAIGEFTVNRMNVHAYRRPAIALLTFSASWIPVLYKAATDDLFLKRFQEKDPSSAAFLSTAHMREMASNYTKYFDLDYLFRSGESYWNTRDSVPGAGILPWLVAPLVIAGVVAIVRVKDDSSRVIAIAGLVTLVLYPVPDLITTTANNPPYTFSVFSTLICVPILAGIGIHWMSSWAVPHIGRVWASWLLPGTLLAIILIGAWRFNTGPYEQYPLVSTGYYGWQFGPEQAVAIFKQHPTGYDRYVMDGDFNDAFVFLDFFMVDDPEMRRRSIIGGLEKVDGQRTELYAIRAEKYDAFLNSSDRMRRYTRLIDTIRYPNGQMAMYLVEIGPKDFWEGRPMPG